MVVTKLIIQGTDKYKANSWIPWAKKRLHLLKSLPGLGIVNNTYRPAQDVTVRIKSVNGLDTVHIVTEGGKKYSCDFPIVDRYPIPHSDFLIQCPVNPPSGESFTSLHFFSMTKDISEDWDIFAWDFGDGNVGSGAYVSHEYDKPGKYTVSLTVSKDVVSSFMFSSGSGGDYKLGTDSDPGADPNVAYANYLAYTPGFFNGKFKWIHNAGKNWQAIKGYSFESQEVSRTFNLASVDPSATVTCYMKLLLHDWVNHYPNYGDAGLKVTGITGNVTSSLGMTHSPIGGGEYADWETFNMGDLTPFIGESSKLVTFVDSGGYAQLPSFMPGTPPPMRSIGNRVGISATDAWAEAEVPGTVMKTTKEIKVYTGSKGNKKTRQVGDSIHT